MPCQSSTDSLVADLLHPLGNAKERDILDWDVLKDRLDTARLAGSVYQHTAYTGRNQSQHGLALLLEDEGS